MLRWVSPAFFKAGNLLARVTPFVVIPIVCKQLVPIFTPMSDIYGNFSGLHEKVSKNVFT